MTGWLIVNEYLNTEKFMEIRELFLAAARLKDVGLKAHTNAEFTVDLCKNVAMSKAFDEEKPDFIIFYDKDLMLARALEHMNYRLFNPAKTIEICDSKAKTAEFVRDVYMPKTFVVPFSYENIGISEDYCFDFLDIIEDNLTYPIIIKESNSSFGMGVHLANNRDEAVKLICEYGSRECIVQEYIEYASGVDVRLQMVGEECVCAMMRNNDNDFRANISNGGTMSAYTPTEADLELAVRVMKSLQLDFAGIDVMHDADNRPVFCEANSNAHFKNIYDLTGINAAERMIAYICDKCQEGC